MIDDKLQFAISQYLDGVLPPDETAQLEARVAADPEARKLLEEYRRLDGMMKAAMPAPEMDWDAFSRQISAAVDAGSESIPLALTQEGSRWNWWRPLSLAATLLICASVAVVAWRMTSSEVDPGNVAQAPVAPESYAAISVLQPDEPASVAAIEVQIAQASPQAVMLAMAADYRDATSYRDARVLISALPPSTPDDELAILH